MLVRLTVKVWESERRNENKSESWSEIESKNESKCKKFKYQLKSIMNSESTLFVAKVR